MSEAPERLWADGNQYWDSGSWGQSKEFDNDVEYVRADIVQALTAERDHLREALSILVENYVSEIDAYRVAGFYRDPETEECVVNARAALKGDTP